MYNKMYVHVQNYVLTVESGSVCFIFACNVVCVICYNNYCVLTGFSLLVNKVSACETVSIMQQCLYTCMYLQ